MKKKVLENEKFSGFNKSNRCVWMTAGVISFKLCPFDYDCDHCDFDKIMRHQFQKRSLPQIKSDADKQSFLNSNSFFTFSVGDIQEDFYFHLAHLWARPRKNRLWEIGIDKLLSYILPPPVGIELYNGKRDFIQDEVFVKIFTISGTIFLTTPLSGTLIFENQNLASQPSLLQKDPLGKGWLAQIKWLEDSSELKEFYTGSDAKKFLQEEACHLKHVLKYKGIEAGEIGKTLQDGGNHVKYLHQILPAKLCVELSRALIASGKAVW